MFTFLLYLWLLITIVLIGIVCMHIVHRILDIAKKRKSSVSVTEKTVTTYDTDENNIVHEHVVEQIESDDTTVVTVSDTFVVEPKTVEQENEDANAELPEENTEETIEDAVSNGQNIEPTNDEKENSDDEKLPISAEGIISTDEESDNLITDTTINNTADKSVTVPVTATLHAFGADAPIMIETPKDIDAARNIAQWHSRDDIVRDKFEKHIQKIRYEAWILKQRNDMLGYEKKLVEGITLLPNDKDFQKNLADLYFHQGKYKKAQSLLKKILTENPEDHNALWQVGEIATEEWHSEDAYVYFKQAYTLCDDNPKYCFSLAQWYYDNDDLENALPLMEKMVKLRPKNIDYLVSLSHVQHKIWLRDEAKQSMLRALELDPMNLTLKNYLKAL